ncbi:MAG: hypothetical protein JW827_08050 [Spirochaetes bacterium]|nr:hypothetical protein [Spirochaetota bacterium]
MVLEGLIGILLIMAVELGLILKISFFQIFATPVAWTGYILLVDYINYRLKGRSVIFHTPGVFARMFFLSVLFWWIFEWFNIFLSNWTYYNLLESLSLKYLGYFWAFGTILPAVLFTADLFKNLGLFKQRLPKIPVRSFTLGILFLIGLIFIFMPLLSFSSRFIDGSADKDLFFFLPKILPFSSRKFLAAFVWLGFIFVLDPLLYLLKKRYSILGDLEKGDGRNLLSLILSGFVCGFLWEFWNYWALTKWKYSVPILSHIKIFEMPIPGYFGFPAFAVELYLMYNFFQVLYPGSETY